MGDETVLSSLGLEANVADTVNKNIKRRLTPQPVKVRADFEVTCFHYEGIDAIKKALTKGEQTSKPEAQVKIKLVAPPLYVAVTSSVNKDVAIKGLNLAIEAIKEEITKSKGEIVIKVAPRTVHERDERELASLMEKLERQNKDVDGDNDGSEEED